MMGHQWTIEKTPPGPQWRQMGAKENAQTVDFKLFFCVFSGPIKMSFWSSQVPKRYKNKAFGSSRKSKRYKNKVLGSKRYKNKVFGAPEAPNVIKIKLLELQKLQTL